MIKTIDDAINYVWTIYMIHTTDPAALIDIEAEEETAKEIIELSNTDFERAKELLSLLALEYYNVYQEEDDDIISMLEDAPSKDIFCIDVTMNAQTLIELIRNAINVYEDREFYDYTDMYEAITKKQGRELYEIYHPNLEEELSRCKKFQQEGKILEKVEKLSITNPVDFLILSKELSYHIENKLRLIEFLSDYLKEIGITDIELQRKIYAFLCQNFYVTVCPDINRKGTNYIVNRPTFERMKELGADEFIDTAIRSEVKTALLLERFLEYNPIQYEEAKSTLTNQDKVRLKRYETITYQKTSK